MVHQYANFASQFHCSVGVFISFDILRTSCYVTASVALTMELLVQATQTKRVSVTFWVHLMARESVNLNARVIREGDLYICQHCLAVLVDSFQINFLLWAWRPEENIILMWNFIVRIITCMFTQLKTLWLLLPVIFLFFFLNFMFTRKFTGLLIETFDSWLQGIRTRSQSTPCQIPDVVSSVPKPCQGIFYYVTGWISSTVKGIWHS